MKTWFHKDLAKVITETIKQHRKNYGPQLCYEQVVENPIQFIEAIVQLTERWPSEILGCTVFWGDQWQKAAITPDEIQVILLASIETEEVTSFVDLTLTSGFGVDFSPSDNGGFEVMYTAWGKYESDASELAKMFGGETWRGN